MTDDDPPVAYYAAGRSGWRAWWTLLHPPYTAMHLSFVVMGASLAPTLNLAVLGATLLAFFLGLGIGAHALDELTGRPLKTGIPRSVLVGTALVTLAAAAGVGLVGVFVRDVHIVWFVAAGVFFAFAYNLEILGGLFHTDLWFGLAWGGFPLVTAAFAQSGAIGYAAVLGAGYATTLSLAQRYLSNPVRLLRRRVVGVEGTLRFEGGKSLRLDRDLLLATPERALQMLVAASVLAAVTLLGVHLAQGSWMWGP